MHLLRAAWWVKSAWPDCPYDISQLLSNYCNIKIKKKLPGPRVALWDPPLLGTLKFNVDGSSFGNPGPCGVGGLVRNANQEILGMFSKNIGEGWAYAAEVKAILMALLFCQQFLLSNITIESDSALAVGWVNLKNNRPWALINDLNQLDYLIPQVNCLSIQHIFREANDQADQLAKEGVARATPLWICNVSNPSVQESGDNF